VQTRIEAIRDDLESRVSGTQVLICPNSPSATAVP
jgi:hypothetical protein